MVKLICISILIEIMTSLTSIMTSIMPDNDNKMLDNTERCRNSKVIALTGNNSFSVKKLLTVNDLTTNYLVYSPCVYNHPDDN